MTTAMQIQKQNHDYQMGYHDGVIEGAKIGNQMVVDYMQKQANPTSYVIARKYGMPMVNGKKKYDGLLIK